LPRLQEACAIRATANDVRAVLLRLAALTESSALEDYGPEGTTDPVLLSRAIFQWWWVDAGHRRDFDLPFIPTSGSPTPRTAEPQTRAAGSAAAGKAATGRPGERAMIAGLSMDDAGLEPPNLVLLRPCT
jgi:hypothetical protein